MKEALGRGQCFSLHWVPTAVSSTTLLDIGNSQGHKQPVDITRRRVSECQGLAAYSLASCLKHCLAVCHDWTPELRSHLSSVSLFMEPKLSPTKDKRQISQGPESFEYRYRLFLKEVFLPQAT